jgi:hypothetical protein
VTLGHEYNALDPHHSRHTEFGLSVQLKRPR